ncbi:MAG: hypothetical protein ABI378_15320 [Chitinophagaceae bacterium]
MRRTLLLIVLFFAFFNVAQAQDEEWYRNFGMNIGWNFAQPKWDAFTGFQQRFNMESGFQHTPIVATDYANGGSFGFAIFAGNSMMDFEYRATGLKTSYSVQKDPSQAAQDFKLKLTQHSGRYSYAYGHSFGKYRTTGVYLGAGIYGGTWMMRTASDGKKLSRYNGADDFKGFSIGVSPQFVFRTHFLELKAYYDVPFIQTDLSPLYNALYKDYGAPSVSGDAKLKSGLGAYGVTATLFIAFGKPKEREKPRAETAEDRKQLQDFEKGQSDFQRGLENDKQKSQDRINKSLNDQEKEERRWNDKHR